jgi:hypothetical protein
MDTIRRWQRFGVLGMGVLFAALAGCQTWTYESGMTLPSGRYLQHPPQYIPQSPPYPFPREMASIEAAAGAVPGAAAGGPLPAPVGGGQVPAPPLPGGGQVPAPPLPGGAGGQ